MKTFIIQCVLLLNILTLMLPALAWSAQYIGAEDWWLPSVLALGYPWWLLLPFFWVLVWVKWVRKNIWLNLIVLAAHYPHLTASFQLNSANRTGSNDLRVYSLNVASFGYDPQKVKDISADIAKLTPDVVCLQEFRTDMGYKGEKLNALKYLKKELGLKFHALVPYSAEREKQYGLLILTRFPIAQSGRIGNDALTPSNGMMFADLKLYGQQLRVFNLHFQSYKFNSAQRQLFKSLPVANAVGRVRKDGRKPSAAMKNAWKMTKEMLRTWKIHSMQVHSLAYHKDTVRYSTVTCGDLNNTPYQSVYRIVKGKQKDAFREKGTGRGLTYGAGLTQVRIDYIFVSPDFKVVNFKTFDNHSDHRANYARIRFPFHK